MQKYNAMRKPRVEYILDWSRKMANNKKKKGKVEEWIMYIFLFILCKSISFPVGWGSS